MVRGHDAQLVRVGRQQRIDGTDDQCVGVRVA
jgi:hypothetical protein